MATHVDGRTAPGGPSSRKLEGTAFLQSREVKRDQRWPRSAPNLDHELLRDGVGTALTTYTAREPSAISPGRGFVVNLSGDVASSVLASESEFLRGTARFSYYLPIKKTLLALGRAPGSSSL